MRSSLDICGVGSHIEVTICCSLSLGDLVAEPSSLPDPATIRALSAFLDCAADRFAVRQAVLFGSRARGTHGSKSDADLAVILGGDPLPFVEAKLAMADIAYDVLLETGIHIQPLPVSERQWNGQDASANPVLLETIRREGIRIDRSRSDRES